MKILHVLDHSIPLHSGYSFRTLNILSEQNAMGWETIHLTGPRQGKTASHVETIDGWSFHRTREITLLSGTPGLGHLETIRAIRKALENLIEKYSPDILQAHSPALNGVAAVLAGKKHGIPVAYEARAFWEDAAVDHGTTTEDSLRYKLSRQLETWVFQKSDFVTTICHGLESDILGRGIDPRKVAVIPNAINPQSFVADQAAANSLREELFPKHDIVIGFLGSFYSYEGLDDLVSAVELLANRGISIGAMLVGGGPEFDALGKLVSDSRLDDKIKLLGRVPNKEIANYYSACDICVFPRRSMRLTETVTPLKPLEAMAMNKPVVASDVGGHKELLHDGVTGLLFKSGSKRDLADTIERVIQDSTLGAKLANAAKRWVLTERTWKSSIANYRKPFEALVYNYQGFPGRHRK